MKIATSNVFKLKTVQNVVKLEAHKSCMHVACIQYSQWHYNIFLKTLIKNDLSVCSKTNMDKLTDLTGDYLVISNELNNHPIKASKQLKNTAHKNDSLKKNKFQYLMKKIARAKNKTSFGTYFINHNCQSEVLLAALFTHYLFKKKNRKLLKNTLSAPTNNYGHNKKIHF